MGIGVGQEYFPAPRASLWARSGLVAVAAPGPLEPCCRSKSPLELAHFPERLAPLVEQRRQEERRYWPLKPEPLASRD